MTERRAELREALRSLSNDVGVHRENLVDLLHGPLRPLREAWEINLRNHLLAQGGVVDNLKTHMDKLVPRTEKRIIEDVHLREKYFNAVRVSFNIARPPAPDNSEDKRPSAPLKDMVLQARRDWMDGKYPRYFLSSPFRMSFKTSQRYFNDAVEQIIDQLLSTAYKPTAPVDESKATPVLEAENAEELQTLDTEPKPFRHRKRPRWLIPSIALSAVAVVTTALLVYLPLGEEGSSSPNSPEHPLDDALTVTVQLGAAVNSSSGIAFAASDTTNGQLNQQRALGGFTQEMYTDALTNGGYMVGGGRIKLLLSPKRDEQVEVFKIRPLVERESVATGVTIRSVGTNFVEARQVKRAGFLLDSPNPTAQIIADDGRLLGGSQAQDRVPVSKTLTSELDLTFYAAVDAYRFSIEIEYTVGGTSKSQIVDLGGKPFRVTADLCLTEEVRARISNEEDRTRLQQLRYVSVVVPDTRPSAPKNTFTFLGSKQFADQCVKS